MSTLIVKCVETKTDGVETKVEAPKSEPVTIPESSVDYWRKRLAQPTNMVVEASLTHLTVTVHDCTPSVRVSVDVSRAELLRGLGGAAVRAAYKLAAIFSHRRKTDNTPGWLFYWKDKEWKDMGQGGAQIHEERTPRRGSPDYLDILQGKAMVSGFIKAKNWDGEVFTLNPVMTGRPHYMYANGVEHVVVGDGVVKPRGDHAFELNGRLVLTASEQEAIWPRFS